jgi:serine/threonine-protein kinase
MNESRVHQLFAQILDLPAGGRPDFIERACAGEEAVAEELRGLLRAHDAASSRPDFLAQLDAGAATRLLQEDALSRSAAARLAEGAELGPYRIEGMLGQGGMGVVYLAHDPRLGRRVALKLLPPHLQADGTARRRLSEEARAASGLDHPNVATVYDIVDGDGGPAFIAMAYCEGSTLKVILADGPLPEPEAVAVIRQVAEGLGAAHRRGIVHRDIKPANVIVAPDGRVRIVDFGIAKLTESGGPAESVTPGTIAYMSPEQTRAAEIDHRSDLWSLGVMFHEMLTGRRPFEAASDAATIRAIREDPAPDAHPVVRRALAKDPGRRYQSAEELLADLDRVAGGSTERRRSRRAGRWIAAGTLVGAGILALVFGPLRPAAPEVAGGLPGATPVHRLAVLPIDNVDPDPARAHVAESLGEGLAGRLSALESVRLIGRRSARAFEQTELSVPNIGDSLGVDFLLGGSVRWEGEEAQVTLRLVDAASGEDRWAERYDLTSPESFAFEERIGRDVIEALQLRLSDPEAARFAERGTRDTDAFRAYHRGRYYWNRRDREGLLRAREEYERAIDLDPAYADAWAGLAEAYLLYAGRGMLPPAEAYPLARQSAEEAIALEADHAGALMVLGSVQLEWYYDWRAAEESYRLALASDPENATAHYWYSEFLSFTGQTEEAIEHARIAQELEPLMLLGHADEARALYMAGRFEEAIERYEAVIERGWDFVSYLYVPLAHSQLGNHEAAIASMERFVEAVPSAYERYLAGYVFARAGRGAQADSVLAAALAAPEGSVPAVVVATIHVGMGDTEEAIDWLEASLENREWQMIFLPHEPLFDPLRDKPRFRALLSRVGP